MRNVVRLLISLAPLALGACGDDDHYHPSAIGPPPGTYSNLQVINTSWDAPPMDVILDGKPFVTHLDYGQGTGEQPITPTSHSLVVQIETPGSPTTVIGPRTLDASANMDYVVAVEGDVGDHTVTAVILPHQLAVLPAQSVRIQVLNTLIDGPVEVYLTPPGADLSSSAPLGTAPYEGSVGPTEVSAGEWEIRMTQSYGASPSDVVQIYDSGPITLQGGTDLVISLLANSLPVSCPLDAPCPIRPPILSAVDALGISTSLPFGNPNSGGVLRVVHDSPDAPALGVSTNGNLMPPLVATIAYEGSTGYDAYLTPGVNDLAIAPASNLSDVLASQAVEVRPNSAHTLYALGPQAQLSALATFDDYRRYATQARLRLIQGSPSAMLVDVYLTASGTGIENTTPTYAALPFAADTGFVSYVQGIYDLTVTNAGSKTPIIGPIATWLDDGEISTVVVRDAPGGGPPYGLIELDDGLLPASLGE
jgi:hypothetical protein